VIQIKVFQTADYTDFCRKETQKAQNGPRQKNIQCSTFNLPHKRPAQIKAKPGLTAETRMFISLRLCASAFKSVPRVCRLGG
jgi:hypothetical protein